MTTALVTSLLGGQRICIVDVGAADGLAKRWRPIAPALRVFAFEPDARSDASGDSRLGAEVVVVDRAATAVECEAELYLTRKPRCSSLLPPNRDVVDRFPAADRYDVVGRHPVACTTVDAALVRAGATMDFIKIDTQGAELDVLRGAEQSLDTCLGIEVEVEFQPLYRGAAVFREIDEWVAARGFELFDLRRTFFPRADAPADAPQSKGQIVFGDALYFRDWRTLPDRHAVITLAILLLAYGFADVVTEVAKRCALLHDGDRTGLQRLCGSLQPIAGVVPDRKDRFVGAGLQFGDTVPA